VGQKPVVEQILVGILAKGHILLESNPGLGKTLLVKTIAGTTGLKFSRIQCTPDLMPADITGTTLIDEVDGSKIFRFEEGPIFANIVLADEINRASPRTQSAMLEAMQEKQVTVGKNTYKLEEPFFVLATQNPIEMEGTFPLARGPARPVPPEGLHRLPELRGGARDHGEVYRPRRAQGREGDHEEGAYPSSS